MFHVEEDKIDAGDIQDLSDTGCIEFEQCVANLEAFFAKKASQILLLHEHIPWMIRVRCRFFDSLMTGTAGAIAPRPRVCGNGRSVTLVVVGLYAGAKDGYCLV